MDPQPMIIEGYDDNLMNYSSLFNNTVIENIPNNDNATMNLNNLLNDMGEYVASDIEKEEPFLKEVLEKYDKNIDDLFLKVNSKNIKDVVNKYIKNNKKIEIDYNNSFSELTDKLKKEFNLNFSITNDINNIKKLLKKTTEEMLLLEEELEKVIKKYDNNKNTILNVRETYREEKDKELLEKFEKIFDEMNNNYIERNDIEKKLKKYIESGIKLNILLKISNDIKSLINGSNTCSVCLNNEINKVLIPCGHTFCDKCIKKNDLHYRNNNRRSCCPICRKEIVNDNNIYII